MEGIKGFWGTAIGKVLIIGIFGSTLLVCFLLGITVFVNNTPESPAEPEQGSLPGQTQAAEATPESQATDTPAPTNAPSPTKTSPSETPLPTSSPVGGGSSTTNSPYLVEVNSGLRAYKRAYAKAEGYIQDSATNVSLLLNEDWKQNAESALGDLDEAANQLESIDNPPPEHEQLDMYLKSIAGETHELVDNYGNGVNQLDPNAINSALDSLNQIDSYMNSASEELDKYLNP